MCGLDVNNPSFFIVVFWYCTILLYRTRKEHHKKNIMKTYRLRYEKITQSLGSEGRLRYLVKSLLESGEISTPKEDEMKIEEFSFFMFLLTLDIHRTEAKLFIEDYKAKPWLNETGEELVSFLTRVFKYGPVGVKSIEIVKNENLVRVKFDDGSLSRTFKGKPAPYQYSENIVRFSKNNLAEIHSLAISTTETATMPNPYKSEK